MGMCAVGVGTPAGVAFPDSGARAGTDTDNPGEVMPGLC